jgi:hypothetical protein
MSEIVIHKQNVKSCLQSDDCAKYKCIMIVKGKKKGVNKNGKLD